MAGQAAQGVGQARQAGYESAVAKMNARASVERSQDAINRGQDELKTYQGKANQILGQQRAAIASNGIEVGYGSAVDVMGDSAQNAAEDQRAIVNNANRERLGFLIDASNYRGEAAAAKSRKRGAIIGTALNMAGTALGSASQVGKINAGKA